MGAWIKVGPGELVDRLTILELKRDRINDPLKVARAREQLGAVTDALRAEPGLADRRVRELVTMHAEELRSVNASLWDIEARLRACEDAGRFDVEFVELARSVYRLNDRRAAAKARIDALCGSSI
ncbi:MAG TPA: hypothetical protein VLJ38_06555, partial [Polyangiaceae bacterium]|nr:hypothetical protein [Polyangiaceae bacterium]